MQLCVYKFDRAAIQTSSSLPNSEHYLECRQNILHKHPNAPKYGNFTT